MQWTLSDPAFDCDRRNSELKFAYWQGHRNFAYDLTAFMKPEMIVELGSQYGCSLFTFCQAIKDFRLNTHVSAVDMWSGDIGALHSGEEVYKMVETTGNEVYTEVNLSLHQMSFDEALSSFLDESINILHIDGGHTFEDVDRDMHNYLPKLKKDGVILFHDVYSTIDNGSCEHWEMIKKKHPNWFEFTHSMGLGVLFPKGDYWYQQLIKVDFIEKYIPIYTFKSEKIYYCNRLEQLQALYEERYVAIQEQSEVIRQHDQTIANDAKILEERLQTLNEQDRRIRSLERFFKPLMGIYRLYIKRLRI